MLNAVKTQGILGGEVRLIKAFGTGSQWVNASHIAFNIIISSMQNSRISKRSLINDNTQKKILSYFPAHKCQFSTFTDNSLFLLQVTYTS